MEGQALPQVRRCARPIVLTHPEGADRAIVACHGFTGYAGELALPAKRLFEAGFDVYVPRYPGHGTNGKDFMASTAEDWMGAAERQLDELEGKYQGISLMGHSMGGAIAVVAARHRNIEKMVLYAPALALPTIPVRTIRFLSHFIKRKGRPWARDPRYVFFDERDPDDDEFLGREYWSYLYPAQVLELLRIKERALEALPEVKADILVFTGGEDAVIPQEVGPLVLSTGKGKNNWIHLPLASHLIPYDKDESSREQAMNRTVAWLTQS